MNIAMKTEQDRREKIATFVSMFSIPDLLTFIEKSPPKTYSRQEITQAITIDRMIKDNLSGKEICFLIDRLNKLDELTTYLQTYPESPLYKHALHYPWNPAPWKDTSDKTPDKFYDLIKKKFAESEKEAFEDFRNHFLDEKDNPSESKNLDDLSEDFKSFSQPDKIVESYGNDSESMLYAFEHRTFINQAQRMALLKAIANHPANPPKNLTPDEKKLWDEIKSEKRNVSAIKTDYDQTQAIENDANNTLSSKEDEILKTNPSLAKKTVQPGTQKQNLEEYTKKEQAYFIKSLAETNAPQARQWLQKYPSLKEVLVKKGFMGFFKKNLEQYVSELEKKQIIKKIIISVQQENISKARRLLHKYPHLATQRVLNSKQTLEQYVAKSEQDVIQQIIGLAKSNVSKARRMLQKHPSLWEHLVSEKPEKQKLKEYVEKYEKDFLKDMNEITKQVTEENLSPEKKQALLRWIASNLTRPPSKELIEQIKSPKEKSAWIQGLLKSPGLPTWDIRDPQYPQYQAFQASLMEMVDDNISEEQIALLKKIIHHSQWIPENLKNITIDEERLKDQGWRPEEIENLQLAQQASTPLIKHQENEKEIERTLLAQHTSIPPIKKTKKVFFEDEIFKTQESQHIANDSKKQKPRQEGPKSFLSRLWDFFFKPKEEPISINNPQDLNSNDNQALHAEEFAGTQTSITKTEKSIHTVNNKQPIESPRRESTGPDNVV